MQLNLNLIVAPANDSVLIGLSFGPTEMKYAFPLEVAEAHAKALLAAIAQVKQERSVRSSIILGNGHGGAIRQG